MRRGGLVHGLGQPTEVRNDRVVSVTEVAAGQRRGAMRRHRFDHDHPRAADRPLDVVADVTLARQTAFGHVRRVRPERDPGRERAVP